MSLLGNWLLPGSLIAIMASMGLSLTKADFAQVFGNRRALIFGVVSMLVVPPLIGIGLAMTVVPTAALAVGFVLLGTTPGGMLSNLFTDIAKGDLALSMSMTLIVSMAYVLLVPFYAHFALLHFMGLETEVSIPIASFFWDIWRYSTCLDQSFVAYNEPWNSTASPTLRTSSLTRVQPSRL